MLVTKRRKLVSVKSDIYRRRFSALDLQNEIVADGAAVGSRQAAMS